MNVHININNELNFPDFYPSVNYAGSLAKFPLTPLGLFTLHVTQCSLDFNKPQKNVIHSLNKYSIYQLAKLIRKRPHFLSSFLLTKFYVH